MNKIILTILLSLLSSIGARAEEHDFQLAVPFTDNMILQSEESYHEDKLLLWVWDKEAWRDALNQKLVQRCYQLNYEDEAGGLDPEPENGF